MPEIKQLFEKQLKVAESIKAERPEYFAKLKKRDRVPTFSGLAVLIAEFQPNDLLAYIQVSSSYTGM